MESQEKHKYMIKAAAIAFGASLVCGTIDYIETQQVKAHQQERYQQLSKRQEQIRNANLKAYENGWITREKYIELTEANYKAQYESKE